MRNSKLISIFAAATAGHTCRDITDDMKIKVVKVGGNVVEDDRMLGIFATDFARMEGARILVHGGGVMASSLQKRLGNEPVMVGGRRVTDAQTLEIVTMVYAGWCNKHIVATLQKNGCNAVGLCGADGSAIKASRRPPVTTTDSETGEVHETDYGYVGDIAADGVNTRFLESLLEQGITPVLCAITHDGAGNLLNTNADTIASSVAEALSSNGHGHEVELTYCFEKQGVLYDKDDPDSVIPEITPGIYASLKSEGRVADGMIPKLDNAFKAIGNGVSRVVIKHACNLGNATGTAIIGHR